MRANHPSGLPPCTSIAGIVANAEALVKHPSQTQILKWCGSRYRRPWPQAGVEHLAGPAYNTGGQLRAISMTTGKDLSVVKLPAAAIFDGMAAAYASAAARCGRVISRRRSMHRATSRRSITWSRGRPRCCWIRSATGGRILPGRAIRKSFAWEPTTADAKAATSPNRVIGRWVSRSVWKRNLPTSLKNGERRRHLPKRPTRNVESTVPPSCRTNRRRKIQGAAPLRVGRHLLNCLFGPGLRLDSLSDGSRFRQRPERYLPSAFRAPGCDRCCKSIACNNLRQRTLPGAATWAHQNSLCLKSRYDLHDNTIDLCIKFR